MDKEEDKVLIFPLKFKIDLKPRSKMMIHTTTFNSRLRVKNFGHTFSETLTLTVDSHKIGQTEIDLTR